MKWRLGSDRFGVHLSVDTEPAEAGPAAPGRRRPAWHYEASFLLIVLVLGTASVLTLVSELYLDRTGVETTATVTDVRRPGRGDLRTDYVTTIRFTDRQNRSWTRELHDRPAPVGQPVRVVYDPDDPTRVKPAEPGIPVWRFLALAGAVAILTGRALHLVTRRLFVAVPVALFLVIWLGGMVGWELVVS